MLRNEKQERVMLQEGLKSLTESEQKVFELVTHGVLNKQVAMKLGVSLRTVEYNRREMMKKLGVESFADLMRLAIKAEIVAGKERFIW